MKKLLSKPRLLWLGFFALCWGISPYLFYLADLQRGYDGTGGEALIPLLPVVTGILAISAKKSRYSPRLTHKRQYRRCLYWTKAKCAGYNCCPNKDCVHAGKYQVWLF